MVDSPPSKMGQDHLTRSRPRCARCRPASTSTADASHHDGMQSKHPSSKQWSIDWMAANAVGCAKSKKHVRNLPPQLEPVPDRQTSAGGHSHHEDGEQAPRPARARSRMCRNVPSLGYSLSQLARVISPGWIERRRVVRQPCGDGRFGGELDAHRASSRGQQRSRLQPRIA